MNESVEILNRWGETFSAFAWPMLWQSSLLIAVIFAFDLMFARRIRASVRYALWMVMLVKLLLPPALALPTGATWWLWRPHPVVEPSPKIQNYIVSYGNSMPEALQPATVPVVEPPPKITGDAWALLAVVAMGAGLLSWPAFRWLRVASKVCRAATAPAELDGILEEARRLAGLRRPLRLKLIDDRHSPAVYGLFRPVILLPRALANQLAGRQLRAVLLHEAIHIRRGDVWVNFAQTLLQIAYWWHPLLWAANARIRRVREEAVDDAVMFALRDGADAYAPTLLEVAKFAFRRPLASLGLVGILESRSALRQRVERLVDFQPSRRTGLTILSLCGIFAFSAVALPMGQGPATNEPTASPAVSQTPPVFNAIGTPANITVTRESVPWERTNLVYTSAAREAIYRKMNQIHLSVSYPDLPLSEVLHQLRKLSLKLDPDKQGIKFLFNPTAEQVSPWGQVKVLTADQTRINIRLNLNNVSLGDVLNAICLVSDQPIKYSVEDYGIVFSAKGTNFPQYEIRTFKVNPGTFFPKLKNASEFSGPSDARHVSEMAQHLFLKLGLKFDPPKAVFYKDRQGTLFVYSTPEDLAIIEKAIKALSDDPPIIRVNARFIELPQTFLSSDLAISMFPGLTNRSILTKPEFQKFLHEVEQNGSEELAEPEATTISGHQTQMRAVTFTPVELAHSDYYDGVP